MTAWDTPAATPDGPLAWTRRETFPPDQYRVGVDNHRWHAVKRVLHHGDRPATGVACCGQLVTPADRYGLYRDRGWPGSRACPSCAWIAAARTDTVDAEVARLHPLAVAVAEQVIAAADRDGYDLDHGRVIQLLAAVTEHAPTELVDVDCAEGGCDHGGECPTTGWGCAACSLRAAGWAGEWEGQYLPECEVAAPCEVLRTMAAHYGVVIAGPETGRPAVSPDGEPAALLRLAQDVANDWRNRKQTTPEPYPEDARIGRDLATSLDRLSREVRALAQLSGRAATPDGERPPGNWLTALRSDCGLPDHEWVRCRNCPHTAPCPCAGGPCCRREIDELAAAERAEVRDA